MFNRAMSYLPSTRIRRRLGRLATLAAQQRRKKSTSRVGARRSEQVCKCAKPSKP